MNIYHFIDSSKLLEALIEKKQKVYPSFSLRALTQKAGIKSTGYLSMILKGERTLTVAVMEKLLPYLDLTKEEEAYVIELVRFNRAKKREQKERSFEMLKALRYRSQIAISHEQSGFYNQWYYAVVRELVSIYQISKENYADFGKEVWPSISDEEMVSALQALESMGLIYRDDKGYYHRKDAVIRAMSDFDRYQLQALMQQHLSFAAEAMTNIEPTRRELSSLTLSINSETYERVREKLANIRSEILSMASETEGPTDVYQLNMQIYPHTLGEES